MSTIQRDWRQRKQNRMKGRTVYKSQGKSAKLTGTGFPFFTNVYISTLRFGDRRRHCARVFFGPGDGVHGNRLVRVAKRDLSTIRLNSVSPRGGLLRVSSFFQHVLLFLLAVFLCASTNALLVAKHVVANISAGVRTRLGALS